MGLMRESGRGLFRASGVRCIQSGGNCNNGLTAGVFASNLNNAPSNSNWNNGASHSYRRREAV